MELNESIRGNVTFVDHLKICIKEKGTILIQMKDDSHQFIGDVYYIPTVIKQYIEFAIIVEKKVMKLR